MLIAARGNGNYVFIKFAAIWYRVVTFLELTVRTTGILLLLVYYRRLVSSVGRAPDCSAGGRGFEPQTGPTLRVLK